MRAGEDKKLGMEASNVRKLSLDQDLNRDEIKARPKLD
jgi:hypothetical protein